ncbi:MAG: hypothetical protein ACOX8X_02400 [Methanomethylophilus sp.]|jgi:hypothetical protein
MRVEKYGSIMIAGCFLPLILILVGIIVGNIMQYLGYTASIIGAVLVILPLGTTETVDSIGAKNTQTVVRIIGIILLIVGISLAYSYA